MPVDVRQERGRLVAQARQIKHVEGPMWFVPSQNAGGYLVNVAAETCSCPDHGQHRTKCKHLWAVDFVRDALIKAGDASVKTAPPAPVKVLPRGDLTAEEGIHVRAALRFLRTRCGGFEKLAKGTRFSRKTLEHVAYSRPPSARLAIRLARLAGVPVDDVLTGKYPPPGTCPYCGRPPETSSDQSSSLLTPRCPSST